MATIAGLQPHSFLLTQQWSLETNGQLAVYDIRNNLIWCLNRLSVISLWRWWVKERNDNFFSQTDPSNHRSRWHLMPFICTLAHGWKNTKQRVHSPSGWPNPKKWNKKTQNLADSELFRTNWDTIFQQDQ